MLKFENVDIIKFLKAIMQTNTKNYQSEFNMDIKTLTKAVKKQNPEDKILVYAVEITGVENRRMGNLYECCVFLSSVVS